MGVRPKRPDGPASSRSRYVCPVDRSRPGKKAALHMLPAQFVALSAAERDAAVEALAQLLTPLLANNTAVSQPDETMG